MDVSDEIADKWTRASLNIDCEESGHDKETANRNLYESGQITFQEYRIRTDKIFRMRERRPGSGIFLVHKGEHYLLTARHMIIDETATFRDATFSRFYIAHNPKNVFDKYVKKVDSTGEEYTEEYFEENFIDGYYDSSKFVVSSKEDDIGLLSFDRRPIGQRMVKLLYKRGYKPVNVDDFDNDINVGDKVYAFGFPEQSVIRKKDLTEYNYSHESDLITSPVVTRGAVSVVNANENYFECDIFVYHGNSGGAIVNNKNKLIGIVSRSINEVKVVDSTQGHQCIIPHAIFIKSKLILPLIEKLQSIPNLD